MEEYGTIRTLIDVMNACGVEYVFFNPGIDNVPVLETIARRRASGQPAPRSILCLDEFVTMAAAHGNYAASGKPQVVSVHSELGTQQIGGALHNAQWGRVPVVFFTETQGPSQRTDWRGEPFDQGNMVRNFVKWDHEVKPEEDLGEVLNKAFGIATTEPCGPVYLTLPREVLWKQGAAPGNPPPPTRKTEIPALDEKTAGEIADLLLSAENPLIVTGYIGRDPDTVPYLVKLAEMLAARVQVTDFYLNFPNTHPLAAAMPPRRGAAPPVLAQADVVLAIDYDMHYAAPPMGPAPRAKIVHLDIDIVKKGVPLWGRQPDIQLKVDSRQAIPALTEAIEGKLTAAKRETLKQRFASYKAEHDKHMDEWRELARSQAAQSPITANWLSYCINEAIDDDTIIVNQTISPNSIVAHQVQRRIPGTLLSCPGGCIGWAPGAALGAKLALPDKTVVSLMGDGAFVYGCPESSLWSASFYKAPYLAIIYNNRGYGAIKGLFREKFDVENMGADIPSPPDYARIAQACNAYGRAVDDPADVPVALKDCLAMVRGGTPAVLDARIEPV